MRLATCKLFYLLTLCKRKAHKTTMPLFAITVYMVSVANAML